MSVFLDLEKYLTNGVEDIVESMLKISLQNPKLSLFMAKYALASKRAGRLRAKAEARSEHIPPFLIASITSTCNLDCKGCYASFTHASENKEVNNQLTDEEWLTIFKEARNLGIGFILLAGGEPLVRPEIIKAAGKIQEIIFPIFTNGILINADYLRIFTEHRNLIPVLSIEGNEENTDNRRGDGVYKRLIHIMDEFQKNTILYGASITVTKKNLQEITSRIFLDTLCTRGCKLVFYVEYVPMDADTKGLAPEDSEREFLQEKLLELRTSYENILFISFPGDEIDSGGCLAAGRGFFHINSTGEVEACPFSPYSDTNLRNLTLRDAVNSPLFRKLRESNVLMEDHAGGCVLFQRAETVRSFLSREKDEP